MSFPRLFLSAGDPSGDNASALLISALREHFPECDLYGLGGARLKTLGQHQFADPSDLAVIGFWEVARRYPYFRRLMHQCVEWITSNKPDCIVLVDYPGFNLRLARRIRKTGIPILYYISPQVWAWGGNRIREIRELVDRMLLILPFEVDLYRQHGIPHDFVGHYLLDDMEPNRIASKPPGNGRLAILPGSRYQEIDRMLAPVVEAARLLYQRHGFTSVVAGISNRYDYESVIRRAGKGVVSVEYDDPRRIVYESDLALTASGTATLETGIIARPMVIVYRTGFLTYHIARRLVKLPSIGLVNLVLGDTVVPELIQDQASPEAMADALSRYVTEPSHARTTWERLCLTADRLGGSGGSRRAGKIVATYLR